MSNLTLYMCPALVSVESGVTSPVSLAVVSGGAAYQRRAQQQVGGALIEKV